MVLEAFQELLQTPNSALWGICIFIWICFQYSKLEYHSPSHALCVWCVAAFSLILILILCSCSYIAYQSNRLIQMILLGTQAGAPGILVNDAEWFWFFAIFVVYFFTPLFSFLYKFPPAKIFLELMVSMSFARQLVTQFTFAQVGQRRSFYSYSL